MAGRFAKYSRDLASKKVEVPVKLPAGVEKALRDAWRLERTENPGQDDQKLARVCVDVLGAYVGSLAGTKKDGALFTISARLKSSNPEREDGENDQAPASSSLPKGTQLTL